MTEGSARPLRRRDVLKRGAGAAFGLTGSGALAGCGGSLSRTEEGSQGGHPEGRQGPAGRRPRLLQLGRVPRSAELGLAHFDSMQGMMSKLRAGNRYDLIFPSSEWVDRRRQGNQLLRIDKEQLSNLGDQLDSAFADPWYDPGGEHSVPTRSTRPA